MDTVVIKTPSALVDAVICGVNPKSQGLMLIRADGSAILGSHIEWRPELHAEAIVLRRDWRLAEFEGQQVSHLVTYERGLIEAALESGESFVTLDDYDGSKFACRFEQAPMVNSRLPSLKRTDRLSDFVHSGPVFTVTYGTHKSASK